ncbi:hypothetical protein PGT21_034005 [Puccinia graminis f. sp. tritici]|uniref:Uncharacterized protein n=1 Tax=Puccinia graminis f. sp. tritici TaxID=56615 RepID=A0A5B0M6L2_PUCGR|nr:hypothetical protein PGT21_034005 [Puccinia graminis f. sp. tritici]
MSSSLLVAKPEVATRPRQGFPRLAFSHSLISRCPRKVSSRFERTLARRQLVTASLGLTGMFSISREHSASARSKLGNPLLGPDCGQPSQLKLVMDGHGWRWKEMVQSDYRLAHRLVEQAGPDRT